MPLRQSPLVLTSIPIERVCSSALWYLLYRQILHPDPENGPEAMYGHLLPFLNQRPLSAGTTGPQSWTEQLPVPVAGDRSFALCVERSVRFALVLSGLEPSDAGWWSSVGLRRALVECMQEALAVQGLRAPAPAEFALLRVGVSSLARAAAQSAKVQEKGRLKLSEEVQAVIEAADRKAVAMEHSQRNARSVQPPQLWEDLWSAASRQDCHFGGFSRTLSQDVEALKGEARHGTLILPSLPAALHTQINNCTEAAECCRLVSSMVALMSNQRDRLPQASASCFTLVVHLVCRLLPMPLPLDDDYWPDKCFWAGQALTLETKRDLLRSLHLISRYFSASAENLRATRETDGARTCVAAALVVMMDALLRRPIDLLDKQVAVQERHGDLISLHYSGAAGGHQSPCKPFLLDSSTFRETSEALLLPQPELALLRAQVLDYFQSLTTLATSSSRGSMNAKRLFRQLTRVKETQEHETQYLFTFEKGMALGPADRLFVEQLGLSIGLESAGPSAHLLLSGEQPQLLDFYPELAWFRDAVFLWKVLLLPPADDESDKASPRGDISAALGAPLVWRWQKGKKSEGTEELGAFVVHGFEAVLPNTQSFSFKAWWKSRRWQGLRGLKRWLGGQAENYSSNFRALSRANPSLLAGSAVETEEDILALQSVPCFGGSLKASESELLLTYLVAPYVRIPLVLNFFSDKQRMTLLQAPQLQAVLDAVLFEPGPWLTYQEALAGPPPTVPSKSVSAPATRAGLLLNELQYSPEPVLDSVLQLLQFAYEQDPGRPGTGREGLILFLVRLAVRVESHAMLVLQRARGASTGAGARQVAPRKDKLQSLEDRTKRLSGVLRNAVLEMMLQWASQAIKRKPRKLDIAARVHAHIAFLFKNHRPDTVREVSVFLASQVFVIMNSFKPATKRSPSSHLLGVGEFELFDVFERWRTPLASWLRAHPKEAAVAMENVERVVTCKGTADITLPDANRSWREMPNEPGNWASRPVTEGSQEQAVPGESYREWLLRTYHQASQGGADIVVSVNQGRYHCRDAGLQLLPEHALRSPHLLEACGNLEHMQVVLREETLHRTCYELVGQNLEVHCWDAERLDENGLPEWLNTRNLQKVGDKPAWLAEVLEPLLAKLELGDMVLYYQASKQDKPAFPDAWLLGVPKESQSLIKEIAVWRSPAYTEMYDLVSRGRHVHRKLVFTSDMVWSFHSPSGKELPMYSSPNAGWSLGKGSVLAPSGRGSGSVRIFRTSGSHGQEEYIPQDILQGLLPDALLDRYKFWRSQEATGELLVGEERDVADQPTELRVKMTPVKTLKREPGHSTQGAFEAALATVERRRLLGQEPEFLVNAKSGMCGLTNLLTRLENLSHILVWSRSADGAGGVHRVEMPRLMLSFTMQDGRLHCDQLAGYWILERPQLTSNLVHQLVAQWGGGTVVLETAAGDLSVLVSALSEPVRPWAERADSLSPAERFLPGQLVLRRGKPSWMANLAEGSRYYFYPLHRCGMMVFTPTPAASLYLLLCRYLTWHFQEVAAMASAISEVSGPEERQLWECLSVLQGECHADAVACRLHLTLASLPFGKDARPPWDVVKQLLEYSSKRHLVSATCALPAHGELVLQNLPEVMSQASALPLLATRREMLEHLLAAKASGSQKSMTAPLGPQREDAGFDRVAYRQVLGEVGLFQRMACSMQGLTYSRPEGERPVVEGFAALRFLDALFGRAGASTGGLLAFRGSFFLIYELFTGTLEVKLMPEDKPSILASALLRLIESGNSGNSTTQMEMAVLRSLDSTPEVRAEMPLWGSAAAKRVWQVGALIKVDHDSSSRLLKNAVKHLRQCQQYLQPVKKFPEFQRVDGKLVIDPEDLNHRRQWAPPLTEDVNCTSRAFETKAAGMLCLGACPLAKLVSDCFGRDPLQSTSNGGSNDVLEKRDANGQLLKLWLQKLCGPHADPNFRFASLPPAQRTLSRLLDELSLFLSSPVAGETLQEVVQPARLAKLVDALRGQGQEDMREATALVTEVVEAANCGNAKDWLLRRCGTAVHVSFSSLVAALMASEPGCSDALYRANQELQEDRLSSLFEKVAQALALIVRVGQVTRAMEKALDLQSAISRRSEALIVSLKARTLSEELLAKRHHSRAKRAAVLFDPRLLVFEFLFDIMLRETQVRILGAFLYSAKVGRSMTHQMIMGDGKTTVIAPLLALILADGKSLVCSCMPAALAEMTRSVLTRCFSSPVAPRAVISFKFGRASHADRALFDKLEAARHGKAVVVAEPTSLKSLVLGLLQSLSQLEELTSGSSKRWWKTDAHNQRTHLLEAEAHACSQVLRMFHRSVLLLDEVDLLLDPLKSELNWPMGTKRAIDLVDSVKNPNSASARFDHDNCLRGKLPFHLLDALFVASALAEAPDSDSEPTAEQVGKQMAVPFADRQEAATSLLELAAELKVGCEARHVRLCPHLVLHSQSFYESHLLPRLSNWTALFLESHNGALGLTPQELRRVLRQPRDMDAIVAQQLRRENGPGVQLFNLAVRWLHSLLPFLLKKVHRVSYGLLSTEQLASESGPRSRQLLSVPFVGKDQPSEQAEFSHPDVAIGFSILAYRLQGLRRGDLLALMQALQADMKLQSGVVYHKRLANRIFVKLVVKAGGRVRGFSAEGKWLGDKKGSLEVAEVLEMETILPLEAVDLNDTEQLAQLWSLLRAEPCAVEQFLLSVLQPGVGTVDVSDHQLTAAGQDLAGEQLFGLCLGFSGTPNDLLPSRLGRCCYAQGVDGRILGTLANTDVVNVVEIDADWTPRMLLELAAGVNGPCFNAFIDVGALVTGLSNRETADYLLRVGLKDFAGVVFFSMSGERLVLLRDGWRVVELAQCGLAPSQRFTFYDHVHTTGMDIKQPPAGRAVLTMSKDTTLRDFAQGAYRMRGLGAGQQISVLMTPEVSTLVHQCRKACTASRLASSGRISVTLENFLTPSSPTSPTRQKEADPVVHVLIWATANGIRQECRKQRLLCQQNFRDVWKRKARLKLENVAAAVFDPKDKSAVDSLRAVSTQAALEDLRSRPEFFGLPPRVEIQVQGKEPSLQEKLQMEISKRKLSPAERAEADAVLAECWPPECEIDFLEEPKNDAMEGEQVQEEEQEEEQEQEQEQEQEEEQEKEQEQEGLPEEPANEKFSRADERQQPWNLSSLACQPSNRTKSGSSPPFYPISDFAVHRGMLGGDCNFLDELPPFLMISENYYRKAWRMQSTRRLRNIICVLEWVPDRQQLQPLDIPGQLSGQQIEWLRLLFELHRLDGGETAGDKVTGENLTALYKSLGLWGTASQESCSFDALQRGVATQSLYGYQQGRFFVALSLEEAQHLRAALHRGEEVLNKEVFKPSSPSSPLLTLRCLSPGGPKEPVKGQRGLERHFVLADFGNQRSTAPRFDLEVAEHCFHFANCDLLPRSQLPVLLRALRGAEPEKRLRWWQDLRRCRRRTRESWQRLPISPVFLEKDEFKALASEALLQRLRRSLAERQLWPADVFHLLDTHSCGSLAPADVERGLEWMLGFQGSQASSLQIATRFPALLTALFRALDEDGDGRITVEEFKAALEPDEPAG
ncbi:unnamed protein product [Symbiodinium sp. CCMP2456]|nr:unnamed protein product [Symbiodinium sp. CCMP2456]